MKNKTQQTTGWLDNFNDSKVSLPPGFVGEGTFNGPQWESPAWGGQFKDGGNVLQAQKGLSFLPEQDPEMMYTDRFNTSLNEEESNAFNDWVAKESERQGRNILMDKGAYDVQGFWKSGDYKKMDQDNHGTDTWKKPNHPTFSNQSRYHGIDGFYGGNWTNEAGYQPSKQTASTYGPSYYSRLFAEEPNRPEHLDASRYMSGTNKPSPLYYAMGGSLPGSVGFTYARTQNPAPSEGPYAKKTLPSAENGKEMSYYQNGLDWKPKSISKNGSDVPKNQNAQFVLPRYVMPRFSSESVSAGIQKRDVEKEDALARRQVFEKLANQPSIGPAPFQTIDDKRKTKEKKKQIVKNNPNIKLDENDDIVLVNPDRGFGGQPLTPNAERFDKGMSHIMNAIEATSTLTGAGQIGSNLLRLGASQLEKKIGRNLVSRNLKNFTSRINPTLNAIDEAGAYVQLDPIGIMGNRVNSRFYNPTTALNTANNTVTGVKNNLTNSAVEASDLILGDNNLRNLTGSSVENKVLPIIQGATDADVVEAQMDKYFRKQALPESTNSNLTSVLDDFKQRIQTPEGQERLKALGITSDDYLKELKLIEDEYSYGYHSPDEGRIAIHPEAGGQLSRNAIRHEIEHAVQESLRRNNIARVKAEQNADFWGGLTKSSERAKARLEALESGPTEIDNMLSGLELRREGTNPDWEELFKNSPQFKKKVNWNDIITSFKNNTQKATDYFLTGSGGQERAPFLAEAQQYMLDKGYIKHPYENITPNKIKEVFGNAYFEQDSPLRIFNIMKASDKNYDLISKALNKMLTVTPIVGGAAAIASQPEQKKQGGVIKDDNGYWNPDNRGKVVEIDSPDITMKGVDQDLIGISDEGDVQYMTPGKDYKFKGKKVREYPVGKNGINQQDEKVAQQLDQLTNFTNYNKPTKGGWLDKYN